MRIEEKITSIFKPAKKVKPDEVWLEKSRRNLLKEIENQPSFSFFTYIFKQVYNHRALVLGFFILLFLGATTVIAFCCLGTLDLNVDTCIARTAKFLADEWKNIEVLLKK